LEIIKGDLTVSFKTSSARLRRVVLSGTTDEMAISFLD